MNRLWMQGRLHGQRYIARQSLATLLAPTVIRFVVVAVGFRSGCHR
jgi:hypothetical protein